MLALCTLAFTGCKEDPVDEATPCEEHTFAEDGWTYLSAPTCTEVGKKRATCTVCAKVVDVEIPVKAHSFGEWKVLSEPTCASDGQKTRKCTECDEATDIGIIDATGIHDLKEEIVKPATCLEFGLKRFTCKVCEAEFEEGIPLAGHTLDEGQELREPTCEENGLTRYTCTVCKTYYEDVETQLTGHTLDAGVTTKEPSCTEPGEKTRTCSTCGETVTSAIRATGHKIVSSKLRAATCTEDGLTAGTYCRLCNLTFSGRSVIPASHTLSADWTVLNAATAGSNGSIGRSCTVCNTTPVNEVTTKSGSNTTSSGFISLDLTGFSLVAAAAGNSTVSPFYTAQLQEFTEALTSATGLKFKTTPAAKEILIGQTGRAESTYALSTVTGPGFTIRVTESKIVILGTDDLMTALALRYFATAYLTETTGKTLSLRYFFNSDDTPTLSPDASFRLVLDDALDNSSNHPYHTSLNRVNSRDYPCVEMDNLVTWLASKTGLSSSKFSVITDATADTGFELLFGLSDRPEAKALHAMLDANEYGIQVTENKILLVGHNHDGLQAAYKMYKTLYESYGALPCGFLHIGVANTEWVLDFPRPDSDTIKLTASQDNHNSSLQLYYTGSGVSADAYRTYCTQLERAGFIKVMPTNTIEGSIFNTYVNYDTQVTLYVAYNDYKHKAEYTTEAMKAWHVLSGTVSGTDYITGNSMSHVVEYPIPDYQKCIRIISAPLSAVTLPDAGLLTPNPTYSKVTETSITAIQYAGSAIGMGYIIQLEDGRFIVIDGGNNDDTQSYGTERENLWNALVTLYRKAYGRDPSTASPIRIAAWYNTHAHGDHTKTFISFLQDYASLVKLDYILANLPGEKEVYPTKGDRGGLDDNKLDQILNTFGVGFKYVKLHTGQVLYLANIKIEVLMTHEDLNPTPINQYNDTNTVLRFFIGNKDSDTVTTVLWPGDSGLYQSRFLCAMYGSYLQSEIVQVAHHGNIGCDIAFYETVKARALLWPNRQATYDNYVKHSNRTRQWPYNVDYHLTHNIEELQYILVSTLYDFTIPFTKDGPDYKNIYDLDTGRVLRQQLRTGTDVSIGTSGTPIVKRFEDT